MASAKRRGLVYGIWWGYACIEAALAVLVLSKVAGPVTPIAFALAIWSTLLIPLWSIVSRVKSDEVDALSRRSDGPPDRQAMELMLGREIVRARRYARPFSVLLGVVRAERSNRELIDVVIRFTQELVRATDEVGRWSEHEVLIILSESKEEQARQLMSRLVAHLRTRLPAVEVRFGVTSHQPDDSTRTLITRASPGSPNVVSSDR
jgi:hypothetical protein